MCLQEKQERVEPLILGNRQNDMAVLDDLVFHRGDHGFMAECFVGLPGGQKQPFIKETTCKVSK